jgi:hypothetical protein
MSALLTFAIECDEVDCTIWIGEEATHTEAKVVARRNGWLLRPKNKGGDRCPEHRGQA